MLEKRIGKILFALIIMTVISCFSFKASASATPLNVLTYGAVGNGVVDDHEAIQRAIDDAALGYGGGEVYFPAGTYKVKVLIQLKSNISIELDDNATILNCIGVIEEGDEELPEDVVYPSIVFMTGPFINGREQKFTWDRSSNITFRGGTIDINGELNSAGTGCKNIPRIGSSGAFAIGYCDNFTLEGVTMKNSYKGHMVQVCGSNNVTIKDCKFLGQAIPNTLDESKVINLETLQIEPGTNAGFPYAANDNGEASSNVTITGCTFGRSETCGELVTAIGTHNQVKTTKIGKKTKKCNHITVSNNTFDNVMYAGMRFCGYEDVDIVGNTFIKRPASQSINYREAGCFLINAYCYNNSKKELDLNKRIKIRNNTFNIADPKTRGIRVAKDNDNYGDAVETITITGNTINNTSSGSKDLAIQALRITKDLVITGNTINGGYRGIEIQNCTGKITVNSNNISNLDYQFVRVIGCGDGSAINLFTHGCGTIEVSTKDGKYTFTAVPNSGYKFDAYYGENALSTLITKNKSLTYNINKTTNVSRHPKFVK